MTSASESRRNFEGLFPSPAKEKLPRDAFDTSVLRGAVKARKMKGVVDDSDEAEPVVTSGESDAAAASDDDVAGDDDFDEGEGGDDVDKGELGGDVYCTTKHCFGSY